MECRVKNILLMFEKKNSTLLDLAAGEVYRNGYINKYRCQRVVLGQIIALDRCLVHEMEGYVLNISSNGEIVNKSICQKWI